MGWIVGTIVVSLILYPVAYHWNHRAWRRTISEIDRYDPDLLPPSWSVKMVGRKRRGGTHGHQ